VVGSRPPFRPFLGSRTHHREHTYGMETFIEWLQEQRHDPGDTGASDEALATAFDDMVELLGLRSTPALPLVDLFVLTLQGETSQVMRQRLGHATFDLGRKIIIRTIDQYAEDTGNRDALRLAVMMRDPGVPDCECAAPPRTTTFAEGYSKKGKASSIRMSWTATNVRSTSSWRL
jgi:hypothetical protein